MAQSLTEQKESSCVSRAALSVADIVKITGLKSKPEWNGQLARVNQYVKEKERYMVSLRDPTKSYHCLPTENNVLLKIENLDLVYPSKFICKNPRCMTCKKNIKNLSDLVECYNCFTFYYCSNKCRSKYWNEAVGGYPTNHSNSVMCPTCRQSMQINVNTFSRFSNELQKRPFIGNVHASSLHAMIECGQILKYIKTLIDCDQETKYLKSLKNEKEKEIISMKNINDWNDFFSQTKLALLYGLFKTIEVEYVKEYLSFVMTVCHILQKWFAINANGKNENNNNKKLKIYLIGAEAAEVQQDWLWRFLLIMFPEIKEIILEFFGDKLTLLSNDNKNDKTFINALNNNKLTMKFHEKLFNDDVLKSIKKEKDFPNVAIALHAGLHMYPQQWADALWSLMKNEIPFFCTEFYSTDYYQAIKLSFLAGLGPMYQDDMGLYANPFCGGIVNVASVNFRGVTVANNFIYGFNTKLIGSKK